MKIKDYHNKSASFDTDAIEVKSPAYSLTVKGTGTYNIDLQLQVRDNEEVDWSDLGSVVSAMTSGSQSWDINQGCHALARVKVTVNSGTLTKFSTHLTKS